MNAISPPTETEQKGQIAKPKLSIASATFSNGDVLTFEEDEIVVFVGPNNAGKSAALRELEQFVSRNVPQKVITAVELRRLGTQTELRDYLVRNAMTMGPTGQHSYAGMGYNIHHSHLSYFDQPHDRHPVASFFCKRLGTEDRLSGANPANAIALFSEPPSHPIHQLLMDNVLAKKISELFTRLWNGLNAVSSGGWIVSTVRRREAASCFWRRRAFTHFHREATNSGRSVTRARRRYAQLRVRIAVCAGVGPSFDPVPG